MNRGSNHYMLSFQLESVCFNEAPIHESGKSCVRNRSAGGPDGFNEAPIHESGK